MQDILENVEEDNKYILKVKFFKQFLLIATIFGLVLIALLSWRAFSDKKLASSNGQISDLMLELQGQKQLLADRQALEDKLKTGKNPFISFAKLKLVEFALQEKDFAKAAQILKEIIKAKQSDEVVSNYARLMLVLICLDHENLLSPEELAQHAQSLEAGNLAFAGNSTIVRSLYLIKQNKKSEAENLLKQLLQTAGISDLLKVQASAIIASLYY